MGAARDGGTHNNNNKCSARVIQLDSAGLKTKLPPPFLPSPRPPCGRQEAKKEGGAKKRQGGKEAIVAAATTEGSEAAWHRRLRTTRKSARCLIRVAKLLTAEKHRRLPKSVAIAISQAAAKVDSHHGSDIPKLQFSPPAMAGGGGGQHARRQAHVQNTRSTEDWLCKICVGPYQTHFRNFGTRTACFK